MSRQVGSGPRRSDEHRRAQRLPLVAGLLVSAALHLALVLLYPTLTRERPQDGAIVVIPGVRAVDGMRSLRIVEVDAVEVGEPSDPVEIEAEAPEIELETPEWSDPLDVYVPGRRPSAAQVLRLGEGGDARLWQPIDPAMLQPTPDEILRLRVAAAVAASNDSAFAEAERLAQSMDWTRTDDEGRTWGVSPGKIHLGDVEIPVPFGFGPPPDYNGDQADWAYRMTDINRAAGTLAARASWRDRVEAMRIRREAERAEEEAERQRAAEVQPDTTRTPRRR